MQDKALDKRRGATTAPAGDKHWADERVHILQTKKHKKRVHLAAKPGLREQDGGGGVGSRASPLTAPFIAQDDRQMILRAQQFVLAQLSAGSPHTGKVKILGRGGLLNTIMQRTQVVDRRNAGGDRNTLQTLRRAS